MLTRRFASLALVLLSIFAGFALVPNVALAERVQGAGSTFAFPVIRAWTASFLRERADGTDYVVDDLGVDYEGVGSLGGIMRLAQPEIDFAATDAPLPPEELDKRNLAQFPIVMGGIAAAYNLDGIQPGELRLNGDVLARMYLGAIKTWNYPQIAALNPGMTLPATAVTVVHRTDGSGSTQTFTRYLADSNADWNAGPGSDTLLAWPNVGAGSEGSSGMIAALRATKGAIGYVEHGQALREGLAVAQLANKAGTFVKPSPDVFAATAAKANWDPARGFYLDLTEVDATDAYPLTAATFAIMHKTERSGARTRRTLYFFSHALDRGSDAAAGLGYVAVPAPVVERVKAYWRDVLPGAAGF